MSILVTRSSMLSIEEYIDEIKPIFESRWMTNMGPVYKISTICVLLQKED